MSFASTYADFNIDLYEKASYETLGGFFVRSSIGLTMSTRAGGDDTVDDTYYGAIVVKNAAATGWILGSTTPGTTGDDDGYGLYYFWDDSEDEDGDGDDSGFYWDGRLTNYTGYNALTGNGDDMYISTLSIPSKLQIGSDNLPVVEIAPYAFCDLKGASYIIPATITTIGEGAFKFSFTQNNIDPEFYVLGKNVNFGSQSFTQRTAASSVHEKSSNRRVIAKTQNITCFAQPLFHTPVGTFRYYTEMLKDGSKVQGYSNTTDNNTYIESCVKADLLVGTEVTEDDNEDYWTTFYNTSNYKLTVPTGCTATVYDAKLDAGNTSLTLTPVEFTSGSSVFPGGKGVIVKITATNEAKYVQMEETTDAATVTLDDDLAGTIETDADTPATGTTYVLGTSADNDNKLGFYKYNGEKVGAYKAYVTVPDSGSKPEGIKFVFEDQQASGIDHVKSETSSAKNADVTFDLTGRRVAQPTQGFYIMGGKKVVVK